MQDLKTGFRATIRAKADSAPQIQSLPVESGTSISRDEWTPADEVQGNTPMAKRKGVNIRDVARESQSSLTAVSLVLNGRARRISLATRERILATVKRLGYRPNRMAQSLQAQQTGIIGILVPQLRHAFADAYFGELISAVHDYASQRGYKILLEVANPEFVAGKQHLDLFDRNIVDGIVCIGVTNRDEFLEDLADGTRPMVIANNYLSGRHLNHVCCDYRAAGLIACNHLLDLGHRQMALIHGAAEVQTTHDLRLGFETRLAEAGLALTPECVEDGLFTEEGGEAAAIRLIGRCPSITAILAGNDKMAIGAISGLKSIGRRVPGDVSVVGCDDMHQGAFCDPPLTTVHTPIYELGQRACERLLDLICNRLKHVKETHQVSLTVRGSTARSPR
jgi:DNA-binding LacI/PurR family transcriptional regulator